MADDRWVVDNAVSRRWPLYTRGNVGEVFPEAISPLGWTMAGLEAEKGWRDCYRRLGILRPKDLADEGDFCILGVFNGYCYLNASLLRILAVRAPGATVEQMDAVFFGEGAVPPYVPAKGDKNWLCSLKILLNVLRMMSTKDIPEVPEAKRIADELVAGQPAMDAPDDELLAYIDLFCERFRRLFDCHITVSFSTNTIGGMLTQLCEDAGEPGLQVEVTAGSSKDQLASVLPSHEMWALGRIAAESEALNTAFEAGIAGLPARLEALPEAGEFNTGFAHFLSRFGFRGPNEWEMRSPTWNTHPEIALAAIDAMRRAGAERAPAAVAQQSRERAVAARARLKQLLPAKKHKRLDKVIGATVMFQMGREATKAENIRAANAAREVFFELARRAAERGGAAEPAAAAMLTKAEFRDYLKDPAAYLDVIAARLPIFERLAAAAPPFIVDGKVPAPDSLPLRAQLAQAAAAGAGQEMRGIGGSPGTATGRARVVLDPADPRGLEAGEILVAPITDPAWTPLFVPAAAVVVEVGAIMSHAVIVARELGIPCACSVAGATTAIADGALIEVDGSNGTVRLLDD